MKRDSIDRKEVEARINRQWPQEKWLSKCHYIIENDGSFSLEKQVAVVHSALLNDSKTTHPCGF
jgi:dephospho-CoA kinase